MADITINNLTEVASAGITDRVGIRFLIDDVQGTPTTKQLKLSELDNLWVSDSSDAYVYSASHGLTSGAVGKPIGWRADGKPYVWTDTASTEQPVAILQAVDDTDHITVIPFGMLAEIATTLIPGSMPVYGSNTNSRFLFWDNSADAFKHVPPGDSVQDCRCIYWIGTKEGDANTAICIVLPYQAINGTVANVKDYGALQDGSTNDQAAIAAAIATGRPVIYFPGSKAGTAYRVNSTLSVTTDNQWLVGDGPSSVIELYADDDNLIEVTGTSTTNRVVGGGIRRLWLKGRGANSSPASPPSGNEYGNVVRIYYAHRFTLEDCCISHGQGNQVVLYGCGDVVVRDNWLFECYNPNDVDGAWAGWSNADIYSGDLCEHVTIEGNHCHSNCQLHIYATGDTANSVTITGNVCFAVSTEGVPKTPQNGRDTDSADPYVCNKHNISLQYGSTDNTGGTGRVIVSNNICAVARWTNLYYNTSSNGYLEDNGQQVVVTGNIFYGGGWYNERASGSPTIVGQVSIIGGREVLIDGNLILDNKAVPFRQPALRIKHECQTGFAQVSNNIITRSFCGGILTNTEAGRCKIFGNYLYDCGGGDPSAIYYAIHSYQTVTASTAKTVTAIDTGTNVLTSTSHGFTSNDTGMRIRFAVSGGSFFTADGVYVDAMKTFYFEHVDGSTFKIRETPDGAAVDITATFSGTLTFQPLQYIGGHIVEDNAIITHVQTMLSEPMRFAATDVNTSTDRITLNRHGLATGDEIVFDTLGTMFQIDSVDVNNGTRYWVIKVDADIFQVEATEGGGAEDITSAGTGTHTFRILRRELDHGGIYIDEADKWNASIVRNNVVISQQSYSGTYGATLRGIFIKGTDPLIVTGNYVNGFVTGIRLEGSFTGRMVNTVQVAQNFITRCYYPIQASGTQNGLVVFDDSNVIDNPVAIRAVIDEAYVGVMGSRRDDNVVVQITSKANKTLTITDAVQNIASTSHTYEDGDRVQLTGTPPTPFSTSTNYWVKYVDANTLQLSATRNGTAITPTASGSATMVHFRPAFGTWAVGDVLINKSWTTSTDWVDALCTTAGAVGAAVFTERKMST